MQVLIPKNQGTVVEAGSLTARFEIRTEEGYAKTESSTFDFMPAAGRPSVSEGVLGLF